MEEIIPSGLNLQLQLRVDVIPYLKVVKRRWIAAEWQCLWEGQVRHLKDSFFLNLEPEVTHLDPNWNELICCHVSNSSGWSGPETVLRWVRAESSSRRISQVVACLQLYIGTIPVC